MWVENLLSNSLSSETYRIIKTAVRKVFLNVVDISMEELPHAFICDDRIRKRKVHHRDHY